MKAVWFNQLDFSSLCITSRVQLAKAFARSGHRLKVVGFYRRQKPNLGHLKPRPLLLKQFFSDPAGGIFFQLQVLLLAAGEVLTGADLVMVDHFCVPTMLVFNILSKMGLIRTKLVLDVRSAPVDMLGLRYTLSRLRYNLSIRWARIFYDGITAVSGLYRDDISSRFHIAPERIGVWTSGVSTAIFDPAGVDKTHLADIKSRHGLQNKLVIMYHGVLSPYRGLQEAVKALAALRGDLRGRVVLVLLGKGSAVAELRALAQAEGVQDALRLIDAVPHEEVPVYLSLCDAGILPYPNIEWLDMNTPLKLLEYLAMEKPVLVTDIPAHRAVLGDARCAFYMDGNSPAEIAGAIGRLAEQRAALPHLGKKGRDLVLRDFTWEKQVESLLRYAGNLPHRKGT